MNVDSLKQKFVMVLAACVAGMLGLVSRAEVPLPSTYLPVDYIEADGSQYLDPGVKAKTKQPTAKRRSAFPRMRTCRWCLRRTR